MEQNFERGKMMCRRWL